MGGFVKKVGRKVGNFFERGAHVLTHPGRYLTRPVAAGKYALGINGGGDDEEVQGPPLIDDTQRSRDISDRLRRRRGVLANIFGGASGGGQVTVGTKRLTGE